MPSLISRRLGSFIRLGAPDSRKRTTLGVGQASTLRKGLMQAPERTRVRIPAPPLDIHENVSIFHELIENTGLVGCYSGRRGQGTGLKHRRFRFDSWGWHYIER